MTITWLNENTIDPVCIISGLLNKHSHTKVVHTNILDPGYMNSNMNN